MSYQRPLAYLDARAREAFLHSFVAEARAERALSDDTCLALSHRLEALTDEQVAALLQAMRGWLATTPVGTLRQAAKRLSSPACASLRRSLARPGGTFRKP